LQPGALIISIDGQTPADLRSAARTIYEKKKGEQVELGVVAQERHGAFIYRRAGTLTLPVR
jgi:hypothetical protein